MVTVYLLEISTVNIHVDDVSNTRALQLSVLLQSFGLINSVSVHTHQRGHTLDLVITRSDLPHSTVIRCALFIVRSLWRLLMP